AATRPVVFRNSRREGDDLGLVMRSLHHQEAGSEGFVEAHGGEAAHERLPPPGSMRVSTPRMPPAKLDPIFLEHSRRYDAIQGSAVRTSPVWPAAQPRRTSGPGSMMRRDTAMTRSWSPRITRGPRRSCP